MSSSFERRLKELERRIGHCPVCRDEPVFQIISDDVETGEPSLTREDPVCAHCGSPNRATIRVVYDEEWPPCEPR